MKKVILDTNFLMIPYIYGIDIFSEIDRLINTEYKVFIVKGTKKELEKIMREQKGKHKAAAKMAIDLIESKNVPVFNKDDFKNHPDKQKSLYRKKNSKIHKVVDDIILELTNQDIIVATQDKILKKRLKEKKVPIIVLREEQKLELI